MHKVSRQTIAPATALIDLGNAKVETRGPEQMGAPDSIQGQKYKLNGLAAD